MSNFTAFFTPNEVRAAGMGTSTVACAALDCMATALSWDGGASMKMAADFMSRRMALTDADLRAAMAVAADALNEALNGF